MLGSARPAGPDSTGAVVTSVASSGHNSHAPIMAMSRVVLNLSSSSRVLSITITQNYAKNLYMWRTTIQDQESEHTWCSGKSGIGNCAAILS